MNKDDILSIIESSFLSIAASIPVAASLASGWSEYKNHLQKKHILEILTFFSEKLKEIESEIDKRYIESDEFKSLVIQVSIMGKDELIESKRKYLSFFLANACKIENVDDLIKNSVLETLRKLNELEIRLMNFLSNNLPSDQIKMLNGELKYDTSNLPMRYFSEREILKSYSDYKEIDILITLQYLEGLGVIENSSSRSINFNIQSDIEDYLKEKRFRELHDKQNELLGKSLRTKIDWQQLDENRRQLDDLLNDDSTKINKNFEKVYVISSLGLRILNYLR